MNETGTEQEQQEERLVDPEVERRQRRSIWRRFFIQESGQRDTPELRQTIEVLVNMGQLPQQEGRVSRDTEDALRGGRTVDYVPPEPELPQKRELSKTEKLLLEISQQKEIIDKAPPPGEVISLRDADWAEYGWSDEVITQVSSALQTKLQLRGKQLQFALDALFLEGKKPEDILTQLARLNDIPSGERLRADDQFYFFSEAFKLEKSSLRTIFTEAMHNTEFDYAPDKIERSLTFS